MFASCLTPRRMIVLMRISSYFVLAAREDGLAGKGRLTQRDISRLAGVSQSTVSLVLNDAKAAAGRIPDETRKRVHQAIRATGYVAAPIARRMAKGLTLSL